MSVKTLSAGSWFVDAANGNLHLRPTAVEAIDQAEGLSGVTDDYDGDSRPFGTAPDVGGDEYRPFTAAYTVTLPLILKVAR